MSANDPTTPPPVEYREIPRIPNYRFGSDGSFWSCCPCTRFTQSPGEWRQLKVSLSKNGRYYVALTVDGRPKKLIFARLMLEAFVGPAPAGMQACHDPDPNPANNRIENLRWDTQVGNMADAKRLGMTTRGSRSAVAKLTEEQVIEIRRLSSLGMDQPTVAAQFGVCRSMVSRIVNRNNWKHV